MTTATAPRTTYAPTITEAVPLTKEQRRLAVQGFRGFWVEASGKTVVNHVRITKYLVTMMPSGYLKCPCHAGKYGKPCCHKTALQARIDEQDAYLAQSAVRQAESVAAKAERLTCASCGKSVPDRGQLCKPAYVCEACKRTAMTPQARRETAILDTTPAFNGIFVCTR